MGDTSLVNQDSDAVINLIKNTVLFELSVG